MPNEFRDAILLISRQASTRVLRPLAVSSSFTYTLKSSSHIWFIPIDGADTAIDFEGSCMQGIIFNGSKPCKKAPYPLRGNKDDWAANRYGIAASKTSRSTPTSP